MPAPMSSPMLAVDFGTSNSAAAMIEGGVLRRLPVEANAPTLPTAVFFPADNGPMLIGAEAAGALIDGEEGRYMRALKSVLGAPLFHDPRPVGRRRMTVAEIVTAFLRLVKTRAEKQAGVTFSRALSGRPVHFHPDPARDAQAEADLRACYLAAGFEDVAFMAEPEAAALAARGLGREEELGMIVDIGGGTSDFSIFRIKGGEVEIVASHGIRLGGTDFDQAASMRFAMPLLGHGGQLRRTFGEGLLPVPNGIYVELATWAKIPFLYTRETERMVAEMVRDAEDAPAMTRLQKVITEHLGHELAFSVERGKIAANDGQAAQIAMGFIERGLAAPIPQGGLDEALDPQRAQMRAAIEETLRIAGLAPEKIASAVMVGGSSLMRFVGEESLAVLPAARLERSEAFTAVVDGLALATAGR